MITKTELVEQNKKLLEKIESRQKKLTKLSADLMSPQTTNVDKTNTSIIKQEAAFNDIVNLLKFEKEEPEDEFKTDLVYLNKAL
jgi:hypothetical protein